MPTYVIGHKNPDTDAICSALGYADLLKRTRIPEAEAARCGEINPRTQFVLDEAGVSAPRLVMDVRPTAAAVARRQVVSVDEDTSVLEALNLMRTGNLRGLPVLSQDRHVKGMISIAKLLELVVPQEDEPFGARLVHTCLSRLAKTLRGVVHHAVRADVEEEFILVVGAMKEDSFGERLKNYPPEKVVLVVGNRTSVQRRAIEYGVRCLVVSGGFELSDELLELARQREVSVITALMDTASTTSLIKCASPVTRALSPDFISFHETDLIDEINRRVEKSQEFLFPILGDEDELTGVFSKSDLVRPDLIKLVLVDHNEFAQAVTGVEQARVLEVLDHHRLSGNLITREPIRFINDPLGSTSSIVARLYREAGLEPSPGIALCLAAGLISDTLHLTSPTSTAEDAEILDWLSSKAGRDIQSFSEGFFAAGSVLQLFTATEVVGSDCKEYLENDWKFAVAQVEELGLERFWSRQEDLQKALGERVQHGQLDFACLLITDISSHYSVLLIAGRREVTDLIDYPHLGPSLFEMQGIVSRKKQLLPYLINLLGGVRKES